MSNILKSLAERRLALPPKWLPDNLHYLTMMGSVAYGVSSDHSDLDLYGFCIPPKELVFPHIAGVIPGFGKQIDRFEQYQQHHIEDDRDLFNGKPRTYDISVYSIVKFFQLCMENNPNMIDSLYTPNSCVLHITRVGQKVRDNRDLFLHKGSWHKFKGYAYSQLHKMSTKNPEAGSKREQDIAKHGFDTKFAYHLVRLMLEVEQILTEGTLDLQRNGEVLKAIRRGEWSEEKVRGYFDEKEKSLEALYVSSPLRHSPDEAPIKALLVECLEDHYGSLEGCVEEPNAVWNTLSEIEALIQKLRKKS